MGKMKIGIVWANPYNKNMGVAALAYSALTLIDDVVKEKGVDSYDITFVGSSKATKDSLIIGDKKIVFDNVLGRDFLGWKSFVKFFIFPKKFDRKKLLDFDVLFDMGEGDSFSDIYGIDRFRRILSSKLFFNFFGKTQVLLPQTIGPFSNKKNEKKAFSIMSKIEVVMSRDQQSYDYSAQFLNKEKISETIDIAFYLPFKSVSFDKSKINVGINVSGLLWNGGYTKDNQFNLKTDYRKLIESIIEYFLKNDQIQVHLVSHVVPGEQQVVEDDYFVALELQEKFPSVVVPSRFETPIEAKSYIGGLDFFTGARMHSCIAAFSAGVPVCPMAYSRKFNGLFDKTLQYPWMGDCVNETEDVVFDAIVNSFEKRKKIKIQIDDILNTIVKPRLKLLKSIIAKTID